MQRVPSDWESLCACVDWEELRLQKLALVELLDQDPGTMLQNVLGSAALQAQLNGLVTFLDAVQDTAADTYVSKETVFGPLEDDA
jgi:hypothetical protein